MSAESDLGSQLARFHRGDARAFRRLMDSLSPLTRRVARMFELGQRLDQVIGTLAAEKHSGGKGDQPGASAPSAESVRAARAEVLSAIDQLGRALDSRASLAVLAETATARMGPELRSLYEEIAAIRDTFGEPVDVNELVREIREHG